MESRFNKYKSENQNVATHISNVNNFVNFLFDKGLDIIEKEVQDLGERINKGNAPAIFSNKKDLLIKLGQCIENVHETYHFNREAA